MNGRTNLTREQRERLAEVTGHSDWWVGVFLAPVVADMLDEQRKAALTKAADELPGGLSSNGAREWLRALLNDPTA